MLPVEIRFAADGMLQSLARWLRLLGYDCLGSPNLFGRRLLEQAVTEGRVFLTRNIHLSDNLPHRLLAHSQIVVIAGGNLSAQVGEVVAKYKLETRQNLFSRCLQCNAPLRRLDRAEAIGQVPPDVSASGTTVWRCDKCAKSYWHGGHVRNSEQRLQAWLGDWSTKLQN